MEHEQKLRIALRTNAVSSALFGLGGLIFAGRAVDLLGTGNELTVRLVAGSLVAFALFVVWVSYQPTPSLQTESLLVSIGDFGWVAISIVLIAMGAFSTSGAVIAGVVAAMVLDFGLFQMWTRSKLNPSPAAQSAIV